MKVSSKSGTQRPLIPAGVHRGICIGVYDLGTQRGEYEGRETFTRMILINWELSDVSMETDSGPMPMVISNQYTASIGEKANLRKVLQSWRGAPFTQEELEGFDIKDVLGKPCLVQVVHNTVKSGNTYANVSNIMAPMQGMPVAKPVNPLVYFSFDDSEEIPANTHDWISNIIKKSQEWEERGGVKKQEQEPPKEYLDENGNPIKEPF